MHGGRLKWFVTQWEEQGSHLFQLDFLRQGYHLPSQIVQDTLHMQRIQRQCLIDFYSRPPCQKCHRESKQRTQSWILQSTVLCPKTREPMETRDRPQLSKSIPHSLQFKMETPESIRASLRQGNWVTSIDLSDAYLHLPIHPQSRKFLRFHHKGISYQFSSLPFGLVTAPLVFTSLVKEVKLLALKQDIYLHQYLDNWLIRAPSQAESNK